MKFLLNLANNRFLRWVLALAWTLYLTILLMQPGNQLIIPTGIPDAPPSFEREVLFGFFHLLFFGMMAFLWALALEKDLNSTMALVFAAIILLSYGFVTEFAQSTVPGREVQVSDIAANIAGMALGLWLFRWQHLHQWLNKGQGSPLYEQA